MLYIIYHIVYIYNAYSFIYHNITVTTELKAAHVFWTVLLVYLTVSCYSDLSVYIL